MTEPQVSIIVINRGTPTQLQTTLSSIYKQDFTDFQVVIVDATLNDLCLIQTQAVYGDRENLLYLKNDLPISTAAAFNWGVQASSGQLLAFMESGTTWHPEMLKVQASKLSSTDNDIGWVYTSARIQGGADRQIPAADLPSYKKSGGIFPDLIMDTQVDINTVMMKREAFFEAGGMNEDLPAMVEYEFLLRIALIYPAAHLNRVMVVVTETAVPDELAVPVQALLLEEFSEELKRLGLKKEKLDQVIALAEEKRQVPLFREYAEILMEDSEYREYLRDFWERTDYEGKAPEPTAECVDSESENCVGCCGCADICPVQAITMGYNEKGFLIPNVNKEKCISCGKCRLYCPALRKLPSSPLPDQCFAIQGSENDRRQSSSGGMFPLLAKEFLQSGGYVAGAIFDRNFHVRHIVSNRHEDVKRMQTSKYVQSDTQGIYTKIRDLLEQGERVLFTGCACQVAGLKAFLSSDFQGLYTVEVACHGVPSPEVFEKHLREFTKQNGKIEEVSFRKKSVFGWGVGLHIRFKNGSCYSNGSDSYMVAFLNNWILRDSCYQCQFKEKKCSDMMLGDFWGIKNLDASLDDGTGTSVVTIHTPKGKELYQQIKKDFRRIKVFPLQDAARYNPCILHSVPKRKFRDLLFPKISSGRTLQKAINATYNGIHFDIGLVLWWSSNYGNALTNYALYRALSKSHSVLAIDTVCMGPLGRFEWFARENYNLSSDYFPSRNSGLLQAACDTFIVGCDQTWNVYFEEKFHCGKYFQLDFVKEGKRKLSYAASFGTAGAEPSGEEYAQLYRRFDRISVREGFGVDLCREKYGVEATQVLDPVFLLDSEDYEALVRNAKVREEEPFIMAYLLNPTPEKRRICKELQKLLDGIKIVNVLGTSPAKRDLYRHILEFDNVKSDLEVADWVYYMKNCQFVITDSFHGTCFSVIFEKRFLTFVNRQPDRFSIFRQLTGAGERILEELDQIKTEDMEKYVEELDYDTIRSELVAEKERSLMWLEEALQCRKDQL